MCDSAKDESDERGDCARRRCVVNAPESSHCLTGYVAEKNVMKEKYAECADRDIINRCKKPSRLHYPVSCPCNANPIHLRHAAVP